MKIIYTMILAVIFIGCKPKPTILYPYTIILDRDQLNIIGSGMESDSKEDTVMVANDTIAYNKALLHYFAAKSTEKKIGEHITKTKGYRVIDSLGIDVSMKLSQNVIDSLKEGYYKIHPEFKKF